MDGGIIVVQMIYRLGVVLNDLWLSLLFIELKIRPKTVPNIITDDVCAKI